MELEHVISFRISVSVFGILLLVFAVMSTVCGADYSVHSTSSDHSLSSLLAHVPSTATRKILQDEKSPSDEKNGSNSFPTSTKIGVAATGLFAMCCVLFCPCLYKKTKPTNHTVLDKELNSIDLASSFEMSVGSHKVPASPLRIPASPLRVPASPLRVPASPLRIPPSPSRFSMSPQLTRLGSVHLTVQQAAKATQNFSPSLQIGEGGFGTVYKARLENGQVVAIKRGKKEQFENLRTEFSIEVELLAKIDHRNLVKLLGYVDHGTERLIVTEYVPCGTLREHLDGKPLNYNIELECNVNNYVGADASADNGAR
ncbi:hypothetical protein ACFE04_001925 [Oxalis oulophora]